MAIITGGAGDDILNGGAEDDTINGLDGNDELRGGAGQDSLFGGAGNDYLDGGTGADTMAGGVGNDDYVVDNVLDSVIEAAGEGRDRGPLVHGKPRPRADAPDGPDRNYRRRFQVALIVLLRRGTAKGYDANVILASALHYRG